MTDTTKRIYCRKIEKTDEAVFECNCCGKLHKKIHHMSNGASVGSTCATMIEFLSGFVEDLATWAKGTDCEEQRMRELNDPRNAVQANYLRAVGYVW